VIQAAVLEEKPGDHRQRFVEHELLAAGLHLLAVHLADRQRRTLPLNGVHSGKTGQ
jgi:hypothetical protein